MSQYKQANRTPQKFHGRCTRRYDGAVNMLSSMAGNLRPLTATLMLGLLVFGTASHADIGDFAYLRQEPICAIPRTIDADLERAAIGELLFYNTSLSSNNDFACATCHRLERGGDDDLSLGRSNAADRHTTNTPTVFNSAYNFRQQWDGAFKTIDELIEHKLINQHEFNNSWDRALASLSEDSDLLQMFEQQYSDGLTRDNIVNALAEFGKTLVTPDSRFDRYLRSDDITLTEDEHEGYRLFKERGCVACHQGVNIGGNLFQKFGVFYNYIAERGDIKTADFGRMNVTSRLMDEYVFKVPSLRNIAVTAPYLHDGSAETLEEVIRIMAMTQLGSELSEDEISQIKAFLLTLTGKYKGTPLADKSPGNGVLNSDVPGDVSPPNGAPIRSSQTSASDSNGSRRGGS